MKERINWFCLGLSIIHFTLLYLWIGGGPEMIAYIGPGIPLAWFLESYFAWQRERKEMK